MAKAEFPCVEAQHNHAIHIGLFANPSVTEKGTPDGKGCNQGHIPESPGPQGRGAQDDSNQSCSVEGFRIQDSGEDAGQGCDERLPQGNFRPRKGWTVLTLRHLAEQLSEAHELPKRQANEMLTQVIEMIAKSLKKGEKIRLTGLGILQVRKRAARTGRNPQTGEPIKIKASKKIAFRPAKELKEAI